MPKFLRITVRFLDPVPSFHGQRDGGEPEWPPSPLRLFQSLVDAAANRWKETQFSAYALPALHWLERIDPNELVVPSHHVGSPFRIAVPNNDLDVWAAPISKGNVAKKQPNELKTMKQIRPVHIFGDTLHYLYALPDGECPHLEVLNATARSITHLGWGIDMVAANASIILQDEADKLPGHRWRAVLSGGVPLRVPIAGTLDDLMRKHRDFLSRLSEDGFRPVPPLTCFDVVRYHSPTANVGPSPQLPIAAFEIHRTFDDQELNPSKSKFRPFHSVRRVASAAGMVRHAAAQVLLQSGRPEDWVNAHIQGHGNEKQGQSTSSERLQILPLPSITPIGIGGIRRVLVVGWPGFDIIPLRRLLNGQELIDQDTNQPIAMLTGLSTKVDFLQQNYLGSSHTWSTVTPIILPGFSDRDDICRRLRTGVSAQQQQNLLRKLDSRTLSLIWKAFQNAGFTSDALDGTEVEYRKVGWFANLGTANEYELPPLRYPRYHLRVRFAKPIAGPLCIGAGRYRGFGLFAIEKGQ